MTTHDFLEAHRPTMTLRHGRIAFSEHGSHWTPDDITSAQDDDVLACYRDASAVDQADDA